MFVNVCEAVPSLLRATSVTGLTSYVRWHSTICSFAIEVRWMALRYPRFRCYTNKFQREISHSNSIRLQIKGFQNVFLIYYRQSTKHCTMFSTWPYLTTSEFLPCFLWVFLLPGLHRPQDSGQSCLISELDLGYSPDQLVKLMFEIVWVFVMLWLTI